MLRKLEVIQVKLLLNPLEASIYIQIYWHSSNLSFMGENCE